MIEHDTMETNGTGGYSCDNQRFAFLKYRWEYPAEYASYSGTRGMKEISL